MTNEELSSLLPEIELLINAYEKGARKWMTRSSLPELEATALSMQISPMMAMSFAMNTMDSASLTPEETENEYKSQNNIINNVEKKNPTNEILKNSFFEQDCEIVGNGDWAINEKLKVEGSISLGGLKIPKKVGKKFTNPVKVKLKVNPLFVGHLEEKRSGKTIAECFDCEVNYTAEFMYPSIELLWEFEKLLKGMLDAIKVIKNNLDPINIYKDICNIKAFVGTNFLCPSMMAKINLLLPTLFMKYSMDLGKISLDLNFVLGGIIKVAVSAIASFLENIRALIIPFIDCALDAARSVRGYIKSVANAIAQGVNEVSSLVNKSAQVLHKGAILVAEAFAGSDPTGIYEAADSSKIKQELKELKARHLQAKKDLIELMKALDVEGTAANFVKEFKVAEVNLSRSEKLFSALPQEYGGDYTGSFKSNPIIIGVKQNFRSLVENNNLHLPEDEFWSMDQSTFQGLLFIYLKKLKIEDHHFETTLNEIKEQKSDPTNALGFIIEDDLKDINKLEKEIKSKLDQEERKNSIYKENKDSLNYKLAARNKKFFDYENMIKKETTNPSESKNKLYNFLKTRYSFNLQNSFVDHEYAGVKSFKTTTKKYSSGGLDSIVELLDKHVIRSLESIKGVVNDFFGNIVNILKNLNIMLDQNAFTQFQIIGEIMQLTHIIRAFSLIVKLIDEGFEGCDKIEQNKDQERILRKALEEVSDEQTSAEVMSMEGGVKEAGVQTEKKYLRIYNKKSKSSHLVSLRECSDSSEQLQKTNPSLDKMYKMMEESLI